MAYQTYQLTEGDECNVDMICKDDDGLVIDITSATSVVFRWKHVGQVVSLKTAAVQDGPNGVARYSTSSSDILSTDLRIQVKTTIGGKTRRSDSWLFRVGSELA